jgi:hypothetical protein
MVYSFQQKTIYKLMLHVFDICYHPCKSRTIDHVFADKNYFTSFTQT